MILSSLAHSTCQSHFSRLSLTQLLRSDVLFGVLEAEARAIVRYPYSAANEDELTLVEGDVITVLDQNIVDAGWWKGEIKGRVGVFPDNFVELLLTNEVSKRH